MQNRMKGNAQGIDVSHWQGKIDWKKVAAAGISFAFIKATQNGVDPRFFENVRGARAAGLLVGAYHFMDNSVTTTEGARVAAVKFAKAITDAGGVDLPPVLDYESKTDGLPATKVTDISVAFFTSIEKLTGLRPMLYTYPAFIDNFIGLQKWPLWIARYSTQAPKDGRGWTRWEFWQYSDGKEGGVLPNGMRSVPGIAGPVDLNEFDGTITELRARYGSSSTPSKPPEPVLSQPKAVQLTINGSVIRTPETGRIFDGQVYGALTVMGGIFGVPIRWDNAQKQAFFNGKLIGSVKIYDGRAYIPVRTIAEAYGARVEWDGSGPTVDIIKGGK